MSRKFVAKREVMKQSPVRTGPVATNPRKIAITINVKLVRTASSFSNSHRSRRIRKRIREMLRNIGDRNLREN